MNTFQPKSKRRFIDKKNAVTFHLVHRSQKDPLITDESAPQHVLLETTSSKNIKEVKNDYLIHCLHCVNFFDSNQNRVPNKLPKENLKNVNLEYFSMMNTIICNIYDLMMMIMRFVGNTYRQ